MEINGYRITHDLTNDNSGFSKWGFGDKGGVSYFIKEFLSPVYPLDSTAMSPDQLEKKQNACEEYEKSRLELYAAINRCSRGNIVRINEFFRAGNHYYIATERISGERITAPDIAARPLEEKLLVCKSIAYSFACLHTAHIVHFDVKPSNILLCATKTGRCAAKVIDFDESNFVDYFTNKDVDINGDLAYLAPETFLRISGERSVINEKTDIFSLALVFHVYLTGEYPTLESEYEYAFESVLNGTDVCLSDEIPTNIKALLLDMLSCDPAKRPDCDTIMDRLIVDNIEGDTDDSVCKAESEVSSEAFSGNKKHFKRAGNL